MCTWTCTPRNKWKKPWRRIKTTLVRNITHTQYVIYISIFISQNIIIRRVNVCCVMASDLSRNPVNMVFQVGATLRSSAWTALEVKPGETNGPKRWTGTSPGIWRKTKRRKMLQNQADCLPETSHTPAPKKSSKSCSPNMVRRELMGVFAKKKIFALLTCVTFLKVLYQRCTFLSTV